MKNNRPFLLLLCLLFGMLGAHRFYQGKIKTGLAMLLTFGGFGVWYLIDLGSLILQKPAVRKKTSSIPRKRARKSVKQGA